MSAADVLLVLAGVVGHKAWRVAWRRLRHPVSWGVAFGDEFAPPTPELDDRRKKRTPKTTEVA